MTVICIAFLLLPVVLIAARSAEDSPKYAIAIYGGAASGLRAYHRVPPGRTDYDAVQYRGVCPELLPILRGGLIFKCAK